MSPAYNYTPAISLHTAAALLVAAIGIYSWRRRDVPGAAPLAVGSLFVVAYFVAMAFETAAIELGAKIAWHNFEVAMQLPAGTAATCFVLEYTYPGRWLTRRNIVLLSLLPLLYMLLALVDPFRFLWVSLEVGPAGRWLPNLPRSPRSGWLTGSRSDSSTRRLCSGCSCARRSTAGQPHSCCSPRWTARGMRVLDAAGLPRSLPWIPKWPPGLSRGLRTLSRCSAFVSSTRCLPPAMVLQQMHAGVAVFDRNWRVISLNLAAERMLGMRDRTARGKSWEHLMASSSLTAAAGARELLTLSEANTGEAEMADLVVSAGNDARPGVAARCYAPTLSELRTFAAWSWATC